MKCLGCKIVALARVKFVKLAEGEWSSHLGQNNNLQATT